MAQADPEALFEEMLARLEAFREEVRRCELGLVDVCSKRRSSCVTDAPELSRTMHDALGLLGVLSAGSNVGRGC